MTEDQARLLFLDHCQPGNRGALERNGERPAVAAILSALRPQPSGETREAVARLTEWRDRMKNDEGRAAHFGSPYADKPMANGRTYWNRDLAADLTTILALIRPAYVASGGQHSSGEGRPETDMEHMARDMRDGVFPARSERKMVPQRDAEWWMKRAALEPDTIISAGLPTEAPVAETAGEAVKPRAWLVQKAGKRDRLVDAKRYDPTSLDYWINAEARAEHTITPLYAAPVPAQDDDKLRIAVEALEKIKGETDVLREDSGLVSVRGHRLTKWHGLCAEALAALKAEGK